MAVRENAFKKTMLKGAALLSMLTKVVNNPIFLAYLTNRPYEVLNEYYVLVSKEKATLLIDPISKF